MAKLSNESKRLFTVGEMVNLMSKDATRVIIFQLQFLIFGPFVILTALYLLYREMGLSTFVGFSLLFVLIPVNAYIAKTHQKIDVSIFICDTIIPSFPWQSFVTSYAPSRSIINLNKLYYTLIAWFQGK
jgi:hypothetical protein